MVFQNSLRDSFAESNGDRESENFTSQLATATEVHQVLGAIRQVILLIDMVRHQIKVIPTSFDSQEIQLTLQQLNRPENKEFLQPIHQAIATQTPQYFEYDLIDSAEETRHFRAEISPYSEHTVLWVASESSPASVSGHITSLLAEITLKIRQSLDLEEILNITVTEVCKLLGTDRALILQIQTDGSGLVIQESVLPRWLSLLDHKIVDPCFSSYNHQYLQGRIGIINNYKSIDIDSCYQDFLTYFQIQAKLVIPIISQEQLWGFLIVHQCSHPRSWQQWEIDFLKQLGDQVGIAIAQSIILKQLQQIAQQLSFHVHNSPLAVIEWNQEFRVTQWSEQAEEIFGWTSAEAKGQYWSQLPFIFSEDLNTFKKTTFSLIDGSTDRQISTHRNLTKSGKTIYCEWYHSVLRDDRGNVVSILSLGQDISDRQYAEAALRNSEARYSSLTNDVLDKSAVGIFILDAEFKVVWVNRAMEQFFGVQREAIIGRDKRQLIVSRLQYLFADPQTFREKVIATYDNNTYIEHFECHLLADNTYQERWLEHLSQPIQSGLYAGGRIEHYTDISDRKRNEAELHRLNRALKTLSSCNQALVRATSETDLLNRICQILITIGGYHFAWVGYLQNNTHQSIDPIAQAGYEDGYLDRLNLTWSNSEPGKNPTEIAARTRQPCVFQNIRTNPKYSRWQTQASQQGYRSCIALPLKSEQGVFAVLNLYSAQADAFDVTEVRLLCELVEDVTYGITALRMHHAHIESEEKFRQLAENIDDVFWMTTAHLEKMLYVSPAYEKIWARSVQDLYQRPKSFLESMHPGDRSTIVPIIQSSYNQSFDVEYRIVQPDGSIRWIWDRGFPIFDSAGDPYRRAGIAKDITNRKHTEELLRRTNEHLETRVAQRTAELAAANMRLTAELHQRQQTEVQLRNSQKQYRTLVQNFPQGAVFLFDQNFRYTIADGVGLAAMGLSRENLEGQSISKVLPQDILNTTESIYRSALLGQTAATEITHQGRMYDYRANPVKNEQGQILAGMVVMRDITTQKQSEATLREAERRWRTLLENVHLLVVGLDRQGTIEYVNSFFLELTEYKRAEILGKNWFDTLIPHYACPKVRRGFQELLTPKGNPYYQHTLLTQSGEEKIIAWNSTQLHNAEGEVIGTMSIGEDITERYAIERMKDEFISVVSHELRTPLTSIHGGLNLLSSGLVDPSSTRGHHVIDIASESAERLVRLVNDILELERLESGKIRLVKEPIKIGKLLHLAEEQMQLMANRAGVKVVLCDGGQNRECDREFYADLDRMLQVLTNLLSNAIKFSDPGNRVWLRVENGDRLSSNLSSNLGWITFTIEDRGRGIPEDKLESIFERFHQVDASDSRRKGGTGLGLAICRSIVEQHGGRIWVESQVDRGSCFFVSVPVSMVGDE